MSADLFPSTAAVAVDLVVQAQRAQAAGLIRVNELPLWQFGDHGRDVLYTVEPLAKECGLYCSNNSRFIVVTREGNAYWGVSNCSPQVRELRRDFCGEFDIEPGFVGVPASNGEEFLREHLIQRLADPFCQPARGYTRAF